MKRKEKKHKGQRKAQACHHRRHDRASLSESLENRLLEGKVRGFRVVPSVPSSICLGATELQNDFTHSNMSCLTSASDTLIRHPAKRNTTQKSSMWSFSSEEQKVQMIKHFLKLNNLYFCVVFKNSHLQRELACFECHAACKVNMPQQKSFDHQVCKNVIMYRKEDH